MWVVNTRYDTLPKLVGHMHDTADTLLSGHVAYGFADPGGFPELPLSMEFRQNVYLLFKEAVNNAVKHASANRVDIAVSFSMRTLGSASWTTARGSRRQRAGRERPGNSCAAARR